MKQSIAEFSLTSKAFSNLRTLIFGIFKRAKKRKFIDFSISNLINDMEINKKVFKKTIKEDFEEVFMEDEEESVTHYLENNPDILNLGILLMFKTGLRVGELVAVMFSDISENILRVRKTEIRYKGEDGKTVFEVRDKPKTEAGVRDIVIPKDYMWIIDEMRRLNPDAEYILTKNGYRVKTYTIRKRLNNICKKCNVHEKSPHNIRKTYGSILLDNNVDKALIIAQMGHTDIACTENHYHRNRRRDIRKAAVIDSIPELQSKRII